MWLAIWQGVYRLVHQEILLVSPDTVFTRLLQLVQEGSFWQSALYSLLRITAGFLLAVAAGVGLSLLTTFIPFCYDFFKPILQIIKATPVASFIILALVWIKTDRVSTFTAFLMVLPFIWANVSEGLRSTDRKLLEMAKVYRFGRWKTLRNIYLPSVMPYFLAAFTTSIGLAWKAGIAAEVISIPRHSIGTELYHSKIYLETADLFAWTVVVILLSVLLEKIFVILLGRINRKWVYQEASPSPVSDAP